MAVSPSQSCWVGATLAENFEAAPEGGGKFSLKKKLGPLEAWQWLAAGGGLLFAYLAYKRSRAGAGGPSSAPATATSLPPGGAAPTSAETTLSGQLTDLTGQVGAIGNSVGLNLQGQVAALPGGQTQANLAGVSPVAATSTPSGNGFSDAINSLYASIGSSPDTAGAAFWQSKLNAGDPYVLNEFAATQPLAYVNQQYKTAGLTPDAAGVAFWQGQIGTVGATQETKAFNASVAARPH